MVVPLLVRRHSVDAVPVDRVADDDQVVTGIVAPCGDAVKALAGRYVWTRARKASSGLDTQPSEAARSAATTIIRRHERTSPDERSGLLGVEALLDEAPDHAARPSE